MRIKALVTGCSGFIGSHLVTALIEKDWEVYGLIRESTDDNWLKKQKVHLLKGEYRDKAALKKAVKCMDYVFHLGAIISASEWETYYRVNVQGTENLLAACVEINPELKKFVYVSSIAACGPSVKDRLKTESDECRPISLYGESKLAAEEIVKEYGVRIPVVIVRPPSVLGTRQIELQTTLKMVKKRILPQLGNGDKQTCPCFVEDVVRALILTAEKEAANSQTYFVTDNCCYSWREMLNIAAKAMGKTFVFKIPYPLVYIIVVISEWAAKIFGTKKPVNLSDIVSSRKYYWLFSSEKIEKELGFSPHTRFEEGIKNIIDRYREEKIL